MTEQTQTEKLREKIDKAVKGRLMSLEGLAWNRQYDWSEKDKVIREHLGYIRKDLLALIPDTEELGKRIKKQATEAIKGIETMYEEDEANVIEEAKKQEGERIIREIFRDITREALIELRPESLSILNLIIERVRLKWQALVRNE